MFIPTKPVKFIVFGTFDHGQMMMIGAPVDALCRDETR